MEKMVSIPAPSARKQDVATFDIDTLKSAGSNCMKFTTNLVFSVAGISSDTAAGAVSTTASAFVALAALAGLAAGAFVDLAASGFFLEAVEAAESSCLTNLTGPEEPLGWLKWPDSTPFLMVEFMLDVVAWPSLT